MIPDFDSNGLLPPGIHWTTWENFVDRYGITPHRLRLIAGLRAGLESLSQAGCRTAYIDGSFVTAKKIPGDFDACWDTAGVDPVKIDPVLLTFDNLRAAQKAKFRGEFFFANASAVAGSPNIKFLDFFQVDKDTGNPKGIIAFDLSGW